MNRLVKGMLVAAMITLLLCCRSGLAFSYQFIDIDYPGANRTVCWGINNAGNIAGYYLDASDVKHGFIYDGNAVR
jgi:hypothetical protein